MTDLRRLAEAAHDLVRKKQPHNATAWYPLIVIKNALYKVTDLPDLDLADADAAYIAAANPQAILKLLDVAAAASKLSDEIGSDYEESDWQSVWKAAQALNMTLNALEGK